ncbi:MAG: ABC transporter permease [Trueperaceae bacterium]|nr:ABC transporter permease [Trueperaceae bacterium]
MTPIAGVRRDLPARVGRTFRRHTTLVVGATILAAFAFIAVFGPALAPYPINQQNLLATLAPPSAEHVFGTDHIGRDVLSRVLAGTRYSLAVCLISVAFGALLGIPVGIVAGYRGGRWDMVLSSAIDVVLTIPAIILAIAIVAVVGPGLLGLIVAISISYAPRVARITRSAVLDVREEDFVRSSYALGASTPRILVRHVLPNVSAPLTVELTLLAGQAVLVATALGFLGLGVQPPLPEWGTMLSRGKDYLAIAPHIVTAPGIAIALLVLGFNYVGDGLRDAWDPKLRR